MTALNRLISFIKQHALFRPEERILLAVSGGRDSVLMAHLFKDGGFNFGIAHCNFNMRGEESENDEQFVSDLAGELDVPFFTTAFNTAEYSAENHISIQMAARDLRYQWLEEIRSGLGFQYIAMAQHQNDVVETMLLNLTRGTGIAGMHGILPKRGKIIRPLLFLRREEINTLVEDKHLPYREDSSNDSLKYARNKIRREVIPVLKALNPSLEETFEANRKRFEEMEILLENHIRTLKKKLFKDAGEEEYDISLNELKDLEPMDTLLYGLFHPYGFTASVLQDLRKSWNGQAGKVFCSPSYNLTLDRDKVILSRKKNEAASISVGSDKALLTWREKSFATDIISANNFKLRNEPSVAQLDMELLRFPLTLRNWKDGDRFQPLGIKGTKKLSDFFIEQKIPLPRKNSIGILENGNGDIIWIAGLRIDERYKITAYTKKVFIFEQFT